MTGEVRLERDGATGWLVLDRTHARNAFTMKMRREAIALVAELEADDDVRAIGVVGAGDHFCGGGDIESMPALTDAWKGRARTTTAQELALALYYADKPTIAVARGACVGLGVSVFAACDVRLAATDARFQAGFPGLGLVPDGGLLYLLPRLVGWGRARDWILQNEPVPGETALPWGLASGVAAAEELDAAAATALKRVGRLTPEMAALAKSGLRVAADGSLAALLEFERTAQGLLIDTTGSRARVDGFLERRGAV